MMYFVLASVCEHCYSTVYLVMKNVYLFNTSLKDVVRIFIAEVSFGTMFDH